MKNILLFVTMITSVVSVSAQSFKISTQKGIDLARRQTFTVVKGEIVSSETRKIDNEAFYTEFKKYVIREMESKGYVYSDDAAELSVSYVVEISDKLATVDYGPLGGVPLDNPAWVDQPNHWSREFTEGTLIIDVEEKKNSVWTASGTMDITMAKGTQLLDRSVRRAFKKFPKRKVNKKG